jgi:hypothetical protein
MTFDTLRHPETVNGFRKGYVWEQLILSDPDFASRIQAQKSCMVLRGEFPDSSTLNYLRDTVGLITYLLENGGVTVYDPQMFHWWTPDQWQEGFFTLPHLFQLTTPSSRSPRKQSEPSGFIPGAFGNSDDRI